MQAIAGNVLADEKTLNVTIFLEQVAAGDHQGELVAQLTTLEGDVVATHSQAISGSFPRVEFSLSNLTGIRLWDVDNPALYQLNISIGGTNFSHQFFPPELVFDRQNLPPTVFC